MSTARPGAAHFRGFPTRSDHREQKIGKQLRLTETIQLQDRLITLEGYIDESSDL
jgi:hypothetical protein